MKTMMRKSCSTRLLRADDGHHVNDVDHRAHSHNGHGVFMIPAPCHNYSRVHAICSTPIARLRG